MIQENANSHLGLTSLEFHLLQYYHENFPEFAIPRPENFSVLTRNNTGVGRFTEFQHEERTSAEDGYLSPQDGSFLDIKGIRDGALFHVFIENNFVDYLEIAVFGEEFWNGSEDGWRIITPATDSFPEWQESPNLQLSGMQLATDLNDTTANKCANWWGWLIRKN